MLISIELVACNDTPAAQSGTLKSQNGVTVEGTFADGAALEAVEVVGEDKILALQSIAEEKYDTDGKVYVYDISVVKDGAKVQPNGKVKVTVSVPDIDTSKTYTVYHVKDDGAVEKIKPTVQNGTVSFETESFSCFIIAPDEESGGEQPEKTGLSGGAIAGIAVGSVAVAGVGGFSVFWFVIKKKKFADLIAIFKKK